MSNPSNLQIATVEFSMKTSPRMELVEENPLYREFILNVESRAPIKIPVTITVAEPLVDAGWNVAFDNDESWLAFRDRADLVIGFRSPTEPGAFWWLARISEDGPAIDIVCHPEVANCPPEKSRMNNPLHYPLDQILTMLILAQRNACIVHAAGVARRGAGVACIGRSGAGKTTLMELIGSDLPLDRLSDDRVILTAESKPQIYGTPWAGEGMVAANLSADLAALVFLHQGEKHELRPIDAKAAVEQLFPTTSIPWFDEPRMSGCLQTLDTVVSGVPAYDLVFRRDSSVAEILDELI